MGHGFKKVKEGFTIIEVMIVLAVAGLIMLIVLVAIPQLQRNQRNSARRDVLGRIKTELESYSGNNNGNYPAENTASAATNLGTPNTALGFFNRYMGCTPGTPPTCTTNINEPQTGEPVGTGSIGGTNLSITTNNSVPAGAVQGSLAYNLGAVCSGENMTTTGAGSRNFALQIQLEGGAIYCLDNR